MVFPTDGRLVACMFNVSCRMLTNNVTKQSLIVHRLSISLCLSSTESDSLHAAYQFLLFQFRILCRRLTPSVDINQHATMAAWRLDGMQLAS